MKIAIVGAGRVGRTLGKALAANGYDVVYGVRDSATTRLTNATSIGAALAGAAVAILAVPWTAAESVVITFADELSGKVVIDATNPISPALSRLAIGFNTSGAELLQSQARKAKFYKAFNSTGVEVMANPRFPAGNAAMLVAGPAGHDKTIVLRIVADVGFEPIDAGELKAARLLEPLAMLWLQLGIKQQTRDFAFMVARRDAANRNETPRVRMVHPHHQEAE